MSPEEALQILEVPPNCPPDRVEERFEELRAKLEGKITTAATPGLREKYRLTLV